MKILILLAAIIISEPLFGCQECLDQIQKLKTELEGHLKRDDLEPQTRAFMIGAATGVNDCMDIVTETHDLYPKYFIIGGTK